MSMMTKNLVVPVVSLAALLGVTACSGDDDTQSTTVATTESTTPVTTPPQTVPPTTAVTTTLPPETVPSTEPATTEPPETTQPPPLGTVPESDSVSALVRSLDDVSIFVRLMDAVDSPSVFQQERGVTLLVPIDAAWADVSDADLEALLADRSAATLLLSEHLRVGSQSLDDLQTAGSFSNAMARELPVTTVEGATVIGTATVVDGDLTADNGIVHVIDQVLFVPIG